MSNQYQYSTEHPITVALGPHRYAYGWQGNGVKPIRIDLTTGEEVYDAGIEPPKTFKDENDEDTLPFKVEREDDQSFMSRE